MIDHDRVRFEFRCTPRILIGPGSLERVGELAANLRARRVLLVTDSGLVRAGHAERCQRILVSAGLSCSVFDGVHENPSTADVDAGLTMAQAERPESIVALGGGSSMDCAKGINFLYTNGGRMEDYWGTGKAHRDMLPTMAVPTTAGTGSEVQSYALISRVEDGTKMACGDPRVAFRHAVLDPELLATCPAETAALAGLDALTHAIETFVSTRRNEFSAMLSRQAFQLLAANLGGLAQRPVALSTWAALQQGACLAGLAIENSMLGAAHALSNPLTARYHIPHGQAVSMMLPFVIEFNTTVCADRYAELESGSEVVLRDQKDGRDENNGSTFKSVERCLSVTELLRRLDRPTRLRDCGVEESSLEAMAESAAKQWTGTFNPRPFTASDALELYRRAY